MSDWLAIALLLALVQAPLCVPPEEPWMPKSDADLRAYVDPLAANFEQYFSALTKVLGLEDKLGAERLSQPEQLK